MGKKWFLAGGAAAIVVAAALYAGLVIYPTAAFRTAVRQAEQLLPPGASLAYKSAHYSLFSDRGTLTGVTLSEPGPLGFEMTSARLELDRPSLTLGRDWQKAVANLKALAPDAALPAAQAVTFSNVTIHTRAVAEKIASAQIEGLRFYPWALLHPGVPSWNEALVSLAASRQQKSPTAILPFLRFESAIVLGLGYSRIRAEAITATTVIPPQGGLPARRITYRIGSSMGAGNDRGIFGPGTARHVVIELGPLAGTLTIERIAIMGVHLRQAASRLLDASTLAPALLNGLAIGRLEFAGMAVKPPSRPPVTLGTFTLSRMAIADGLPVSASLTWNGLRLTRADLPTPRARLAFDQLGLHMMTISFDAAYDWELQADRFSLQDIRLKVAELGSLDVSASLIGVTPGRDTLDQVLLTHAVLRYRDASLVERAFKAAAAFMHADPSTLRRQMIGVTASRADAFKDSPAISEATKEMSAFLQNPHALTVTLAPAKPVPLALLRNFPSMTPPDLASLLGLHVTAHP